MVDPSGTKCRAGTGASVAQVPEPRPKSVVQVPEPQCQACTGTAHRTRQQRSGRRDSNPDLTLARRGIWFIWFRKSPGLLVPSSNFHLASTESVPVVERVHQLQGQLPQRSDGLPTIPSGSTIPGFGDFEL